MADKEVWGLLEKIIDFGTMMENDRNSSWISPEGKMILSNLLDEYSEIMNFAVDKTSMV